MAEQVFKALIRNVLRLFCELIRLFGFVILDGFKRSFSFDANMAYRLRRLCLI